MFKDKYIKYKKKYLELKKIIRNKEESSTNLTLKGGSFNRLSAPKTCGLRDPIEYIRNLLRNGEIMQVLDIIEEVGPVTGASGFNEMLRRSMFTSTLAWAVPNLECLIAITEFVNGDNVLEVGCGSGLWAGLISATAVIITATDPFLTHGFDPNKTFVDVERIDAATAIAKYSNHEVLMLIWPPYNSPLAIDTLRSFTGDRLIFIGESEGGCTADDAFYEELSENWDMKTISIPTWDGIYDRCYLCRRIVKDMSAKKIDVDVEQKEEVVATKADDDDDVDAKEDEAASAKADEAASTKADEIKKQEQ